MRPRLEQAAWVIFALDDVESDMSRFHRVDDIYAMDSHRFFRLANRLIFYQGAVMATLARYAAQADDASPQPAAPAAAPPSPVGAGVVPSNRAALALSDLGPLISWGG